MEFDQLTSAKESLLTAIAQRDGVRSLLNALGEDGTLFLVGGTVRDALLGRPIKDLDFSTNLLPAEVSTRLQRSGMRVIPTGLQHQTVTALLSDEESTPVEITTLRGPGISPTSGVVASGDIATDLLLRDFTINAMAYDVRGLRLITPPLALEDLRDRVIRGVDDPFQRFREDPLRVLRAVRFACELGFSLDPDTEAAANRFRGSLGTISIERVREEFNRILLSEEVERGLVLLHKLGFFQELLPEFETCYGFEQNRFHKADVFFHTVEVVRRARPDLVLRLAALFHDIGKPPSLSVDEDGDRHFFLHEVIGADMTESILRRFKYSNAIIQDVTSLVRLHMRPIEAGPPGLRRLIRDTGELFETWRELKIADSGACKIEQHTLEAQIANFDERIAQVRLGPAVSPLKNLALTGTDLLQAGYPESRTIGVILRSLHESVLDAPELNERETLLKLALERFPKA